MIRTITAVAVLSCLVCTDDGGSQLEVRTRTSEPNISSVSPRRSTGRRATPLPNPSATPFADDSVIFAYLRSRNFVLDTILSKAGTRWAVGARQSITRDRQVFIIGIERGVAHVLGKPIPVAEYEPYPAAQWFSYEGKSNQMNGLVLSLDMGSEGVAGARVFRVRGRDLQLTYQDRRTACKPAALASSDGRQLLRIYSTYLARADCEAECFVLIREEVGVEPAWTEYLEWRDGRWRTPKNPPRKLYAPIEQGYRRAAAFVRTKESGRCTRNGGAYSRLFESWANRAARL